MASESLATAQQLDAWGFNVLPAKYKGKAPTVDWRRYQGQRTTEQLEAWFDRGRRFNWWVLCGAISGFVVLDVDNEAADLYWRQELGDELLDSTALVKTAHGFHYYFRLEEGDNCASWSVHNEEIDFDVRADGTGVIAPPSIHESGHVYEWVRDPDCAQPLPEKLRGPSSGAGATSQEAMGNPVRSMLAELLRHPPAEGGRNVWLAQVCGHMAKMVEYFDAYESLVRMVNDGLEAPLDAAEVDKTLQSIWQSEQEKETDAPSEANGWLASDGKRLYSPARQGKGEDAQVVLAAWSDFDLRALGLIEDEEGGRSYTVEIHRGGDVYRSILTPSTLARPVDLSEWLGRYGATIIPPANEIHKGSFGARVQRYLESQNPPRSIAIDHLGWNNQVGGMVTHEGVIDETGLRPHQGVVPHPRLVNWAPYRYGFVEVETARRVLSQVLTFHTEDVAGVYGAWWAACFLKAQLMSETALFPFMALEAPSESGKTTGFFSLMNQLNGSAEGHGEYTLPVLRDRASAHRNGIVWIDDMSHPDQVLDLLRQVTGEGTRAKKGSDRMTQETVKLIAPVVISGEGLGALGLEKALLDRAIRLEVTSPKGRKSVVDPTRPQWDDIKDLLKEWDHDLTQVAGTIVQLALSEMENVDRLRSLRSGNGRHADKIAILRIGARVLAGMVQDSKWVEVVDDWCRAYEDIGTENVLTTQILPRMLRERTAGIPRKASGHEPVFVDKARQVVWYNEQRVADVWVDQYAKTPRERQLGTLSSIKGQRVALGETETRRFSILANRTRGQADQLRAYVGLSEELSRRILERTEMQLDDQADTLL